MTFVGSDISGLPSIKLCAWSYFRNISAIVLSDGTVHFYNEKGIETEIQPVQRHSRATSLDWSPNEDVLAIGWNDGIFSVWRDGFLTEAQQKLSSPINLVAWHPSLPLVLCADESGLVVSWEFSTHLDQAFVGSANTTFTIAVWIPRDIPYAFLASCEGDLYAFDGSPQALSEICNCPKPIHALVITPSTDRVVVFSGENILSQYNLPPSLQKHSQSKLPVGDTPKLIKIKSDTICYAISNAISIVNVLQDETYILRTPNEENISSIHFDLMYGVLYALTTEGKMLSYKVIGSLSSKSGFANPVITDLHTRVDEAFWSTSCSAFIAVCNGRRPHIFYRMIPQTIATKEYIVYQSDHRSITLRNGNTVKTHNNITTIRTNSTHFLIGTDNDCSVYSVRSGNLTPFGDIIQTNTSLVCINGENTYECLGSVMRVRNIQGVIKQTVNIGTNSPVKHMECNGNYIVAMTEDCSLFLYDVSRRQPKLQFSTVFQPDFPVFRISSISLSCSGFCVSITIDHYKDGQWRPSNSIYLHSPQFDKTVQISFDDKIPREHRWDSDDPRLICVQTTPFSLFFDIKLTDVSIVPMFVADNLDCFKQSPLQISENFHLCFVDMPKVILTDYESAPEARVLPQFEGLDSADEESKKALMELNFYLASGDIDSAFNSIRSINNKGTWRSLAQTCAQTRRVDLADLCFGRMEDGGSAVLLKKSHHGADSDVGSIVLVDTQLGIYDEAKSVARDNKRFDLLSSVHKSLAEWKDALRVCAEADRVHYKSYCYQYARSLEIQNDLKEAVKFYEYSGTLGDELPRLSLQADDLKLLFNFVAERSIRDVPNRLLLWLARFFEAHNQFQHALEYYEYASSTTNVIRMNCCYGKWDEAQKIANKSSKPSAYCMYARMLSKKVEDMKSRGENVDKLTHEVVEMFRRARQFGQALEFAMSYSLVDDILSLSFSAPSYLTCKAAQWFESQKEYKNAILMYSRANKLNRALGLCFKHKQYDALDEISDNLTTKTDKSVLMRCGQYFTESERWSKAAQCYALAKQFDIVIDLCNKHNIKLSSHVIQEISDDKSDPEVLKRFAALCEQQREFTIAAQLYLKVKEHIAAIKALIRAGDTPKVIKFTNTLKKKEVYVLSAIYLQSTNYRESQQIFNTIVDFYKKADSPEKLARFYESAAQKEIDEYQGYSRGLELLKMAIEVLQENKGIKNGEYALQSVSNHAKLVTLYIQAQSLLQTEPKKAIAICVELLRTKDIDQCLRSDDVYILMVKCYATQGNYKNAYKLLDDLRSSGTDLAYFLDIKEIEHIYREAGQTYEASNNANNNDVDDDDINIDEVEDIEG